MASNLSPFLILFKMVLRTASTSQLLVLKVWQPDSSIELPWLQTLWLEMYLLLIWSPFKPMESDSSFVPTMGVGVFGSLSSSFSFSLLTSYSPWSSGLMTLFDLQLFEPWLQVLHAWYHVQVPKWDGMLLLKIYEHGLYPHYCWFWSFPQTRPNEPVMMEDICLGCCVTFRITILKV